MFRNAIVIALLVAAGAVSARAAVIYDNHTGPSSTAWTSGMTSSTFQQMADDFVLSDTANVITGIRWWGVYDRDNVVPDAFTVYIYADDAGAPAIDPLHEIVVTDAHRSGPVGTIPLSDTTYFVEYEYWTTVSPIALNPGSTYWISIFNDTSGSDGINWGWSTRSVDSTSFAGRSNPDSGWGVGVGYDQAFQLMNDGLAVVPAPPALGLVCMGLAGLALRRRLRRS